MSGGRSQEERERARLERERRRARAQGLPEPEAAPAPEAPSEVQPAPAPEPDFEPDFGHAPAGHDPVAEPRVPPPWIGLQERQELVDEFGPPPGPPQKVSHGRVLRVALAALGAILLVALAWFWLTVFEPFAGDGKGTGSIAVTIPEGADVSAIGDLLEEKNVIGSARNFGWRAGWSGKSADFKAGRYNFGEGMSYSAVIDQLAAGPNAGVTTVAIPEGRSRWELANQLAGQGLTGDYMKATERSRRINLQRYGAPKNVASLEGFLFPATYEVPAGADVDRLVPQQLAAFRQNIAKVDMAHARKKNLTVFDVVTIASLIDREVSVARERRLVAAVIYNRLSQGIPLGIDATSRFETRNWTDPLTNAVLQKDTPYNTRINKGLPPGPIGSPGLAAIEAAARPANSDYLYYVANPCEPGTHTFTKTYAEFEAAAQRYNEAREKAGGRQPRGC